MTTSSKRNKKGFRIIISLVILLIAGFISIFYIVLGPNIRSNDGQNAYLYIYDNYTFDDVLQSLRADGNMLNTGTFTLMAKAFNYDQKVRPGKYLLKEGMSNLSLVRNLRNGSQEPVKLIINNIRTRDQLASLVARELMADSAALIHLLNNDTLMAAHGFTTDNSAAVIIPNTYEFFWDTNEREFFDRMYKEYNRFWTDDRRQKAAAIPMTPTEVITLASIIEEETNKRHEHPIIAGLYINRIKIGMPLQACPTIRFALNDYTIRRVLFSHLKTQSPYNTYKNKGLPPGPIRLPSIFCIDAVLNYEKHDYLFMVANASLNGEHTFARTGEEHMRNARAYQQALDTRGIK